MPQDAAALFSEIGLSAISILALVFLALLFSCYIKIVTVLGMLRAGLGFGSLPAAFVTGGLALALSFFVMFPQLQDSADAVDGALRGRNPVTDHDRAAAIDAGIARWKIFLSKHAHHDEVTRFGAIAKKIDEKNTPPPSTEQAAKPAASDPDSWRILAPAFLVSELKDAFSTGLSVFLPFLVIDLLVATLLVAVGMERINPAVVSFPLKVLLFVLVDGWTLITTNLVSTYTS